MCGRTPGRVVFFGLNITDNIKSVGFAFPGDVSLALNMTNVILRLCRRISRKGGIFRIEYYG